MVWLLVPQISISQNLGLHFVLLLKDGGISRNGAGVSEVTEGKLLCGVLRFSPPFCSFSGLSRISQPRCPALTLALKQQCQVTKYWHPWNRKWKSTFLSSVLIVFSYFVPIRWLTQSVLSPLASRHTLHTCCVTLWWWQMSTHPR